MPLRETTFITRNASTWRRLEREVVAPDPDPDILRDLYASVSDDLSYARTHYANRSVKSFLNQKAATLALSLYRNRREGIALRRFYTETIPLELYAQRVALRVALAVFLGGFLVGWFSSVADPEFARSVLSSYYVEMTVDNIAKGDPMAVYKGGSMLGSALGITGNNLRVALLCFASGITWGAGALFICLSNAVMVGCFQQFFFARGVGWESILGIWTHGTIEISCIIIACGAGLALAKGIIWPGTFTRARAFQLSARSGLRIMAAIAPFIVVAGFIEGFITRLTEVPTLLRVGFLLVNLAVILVYFVWLPMRVGRSRVRPDEDYGRLAPDRTLDWRPHRQMGTAEMFFDSVRYFGGAGRYSLLVALGFGITAVLLSASVTGGASAYVDTELLGPFGDVAGKVRAGIFSGSRGITLIFAAITVWVMADLTRAVHADLPWADPNPGSRESARADLPLTPRRQRATMLVGLAVPWTILMLLAWVNVGLGIVTLPFLALWMRGISYQRGNVALGLSDAFRFGFGNFGSVVGLTSILLLTALGLGILHEALWVQFGLEFIALNLPALLWGEPVRVLLTQASELAVALAYTLFCIQVFGLQYASAREHVLATGLAERVEAQFAQ